jgi:hypothetical protein
MLSKKQFINNLEFEQTISKNHPDLSKEYQVKITKVYVPNPTDWHYKIGSE